MKKTNDKREYRRAEAILKKCEGRTYKAIAKEHSVDERTVQRWIAEYIKKGGTEGLTIRKSSGSKPRITDKDREIDYPLNIIQRSSSIWLSQKYVE